MMTADNVSGITCPFQQEVINSTMCTGMKINKLGGFDGIHETDDQTSEGQYIFMYITAFMG